jgi:hypothetical protein
VSFPTRQQATGTELLLWLPLSPDPSGLFSVAASIHLSAPTRPVVRRKAGRGLVINASPLSPTRHDRDDLSRKCGLYDGEVAIAVAQLYFTKVYSRIMHSVRHGMKKELLSVRIPADLRARLDRASDQAKQFARICPRSGLGCRAAAVADHKRPPHRFLNPAPAKGWTGGTVSEIPFPTGFPTHVHVFEDGEKEWRGGELEI